MKNRILFFLIFIVLAHCIYAQKSNPIIVYDTITVYDTIVVYDTIKTENKVESESNFKNNFTSEKAYLAIDTTNFSAAVLLINKKDTATLSINSIILSENTKNVDTMKKEILTIVAAALFTQASVSQTITDSTTTVNTIENTTIAQNPQNVEKVVFKNKNSGKKYEVALPSTHTIKFQNQKLKNKYLRHRPTHLFSFNKSTNLITHIDSTFITIKFAPPIKRRTIREDWKSLKEDLKTRKNKKIETFEDTENRYFETVATYTDSVSIPIDAIKSIRFSKLSMMSKRNFKLQNTLASSVFVICSFEFYLIDAGLVTFPAGVGIIAGTIVIGKIIYTCVLTKKIDLNKWQIVQP